MQEAGPESHVGGRILIVDDEATVRRSLGRFLIHIGHRVEAAGTVAEALACLAGQSYDLVITDLRMSGGSGLELLEQVRDKYPSTRTILISGNAGPADAARALERGVDFLLVKPFGLEDLRVRVDQALARLRVGQQAMRERTMLEARVRQREAESKTWILRAAHALVAAVEAKDVYTAGHATRVSAYALAIANEVGGIDPGGLRLASDLYDIGKIGVPDIVLNKADPLSEEELALVKKHPETGARILAPLIDDPLVIGVVRWHHERWDGQGYPDGLSGEQIPLAARVLAVADTLDAMVSSRAYREKLPWPDAVAEIRRCSGSQFDPQVVAAFELALPRLEDLYRSEVGS